ncbi:phage tail tip lysozyme [Kribbella catacumbae]|uniref:phage tail tip lysozyme n=1 Tax=Kribbella catacumbae TaxID=460086 RepID=UPI0003668745|nr:phage tail tip lysozyme [Kribbella catacumbae]
MGDSKAMPIVGGVMLVLFLPLIIVIALLVGVLTGMDTAAACTPTAPAESSMAWPTDKKEPDQGWDDEGGETHKGMDFVVDKGSKVYAVESGTVKSIDGDWIKIKHGTGLETWYKFFDTKVVKEGDPVGRAQVIGTSGSSEDEAAPGKKGAHLHFEVWAQADDGGALKQTDPAPLFDSAAPAGPGGGCGCNTGGPLVGGNNQEKAFNFLVGAGYTKEQASGIVGNMIHESSVEPQRLNGTTSGTVTPATTAVGLNKAWGIVQWYPASKMINAARGQGASFETIETLEYQLKFLKEQLDGTGPVALKAVGDKMKATKTVDEAAYLFAHDYEIFTTNDNDPEYARRQATARQVFSTIGGGTNTPTGDPGAGPSTACAAGSGNIAEVAKSLAWPDGGHGKNQSDATAAFQEALPKYNSTNGYEVWSDCGRFVATVMRMSGADPDYPMVSTGVQDNYVRTSGKYDVFDNITPGELQPGDILIGPGHTYLFVGQWGKYDSASGSLGGHVPQATYAYNIGRSKQFAAARLKK